MIIGFLGTILSGLLILGPVIFVIESRAAGALLAQIHEAEVELDQMITSGEALKIAFPDHAEFPRARASEPMRDAVCSDADIPLAVEKVKARASLCLTEDEEARRFFVVGMSWREAAPIRDALKALHSVSDMLGITWLTPRQVGLVVHQEFWP